MNRSTALSYLAGLGFADLDLASEHSRRLDEPTLRSFAAAADPDHALRCYQALCDAAPDAMAAITAEPATLSRLVRTIGASAGLAEFLLRNPDQLSLFEDPIVGPLGTETMVSLLLGAVGDASGEAARIALRVAYRRELARLAAWDLEQTDPVAVVDRVGEGLADLAGAALDVALLIARRSSRFPEADVARTRLAIIGMGKAGARELNYLSDVDVIFVGAGDDGLGDDRSIEIATHLALDTTRAIQDIAREPALWEVDANLRPEGRNGALVRSLASHIAYYERWAQSWEFQALLKARPIAGDPELGRRYLEAVAPQVWASSGRENFVDSVQRMRERVTENIPADEVDIQLKLGPGGLRDIEFTVQLLQLVHGAGDEAVRHRGTLPALIALADGGYIGRVEAADFSRDYRILRVLEHRLQLSRLRRTHLMPREEERLRVLARASGLAPSAEQLVETWKRTQVSVRSLHERLFYRPLLSAVAALPNDGYSLTSEQAAARLAASGFRDPRGALRHIAALTSGVSRRAAIQRALLPVMLGWFAEGADPDHALLAFRKLSEQLGEAHWFLRMLRDSSGAAHRLTRVLSSSRYVVELFDTNPEAVAWLEKDADLRPRSAELLQAETAATVARHREDVNAAALALRTARRREVLRLSLAAILGVVSIEELGRALSDVTTALLSGLVELAHPASPGFEFAVIAMGRYGGAELGFGSDADVMYVYRQHGLPDGEPQQRAERIVHEISRLSEDLRLPLDLDIGLRPEGKNGAIVRSFESYRAYYRRWSLSWEAQALLRARGVVGDPALLRDFEALADDIRFPASFSDDDVREIKRIKARIEAERLPRGTDPRRHLKLGRGSLSDVEWLVQLWQLRNARAIPALRTTSTLGALDAAQDAGLVSTREARMLRSAWLLSSRVRSAMTLWSAKTTDILPGERQNLDGVARILDYPPGSATRLEDDYLRVTRLCRQVFERLFYGPTG